MKTLVLKIRKFGKNKDFFSSREVKLLRKLINRQKREGYTNFNEVMFYFPGKTPDIVENKYNEKYLYLERRAAKRRTKW